MFYLREYNYHLSRHNQSLTMTDTTDSIPTSPTKNSPLSEKRHYSIGVDLGSSKVTISRSDLSKSSVCPDVIADLMDIRNIPNQIMFPHEPGLTRAFGNNASAHRSFVSKNHTADMEEDLSQKYDIVIGAKKFNLPLYIIRTMIMGHIRKILDHRAELKDIQNTDDAKQKNKKSIVVIVPSYSSTAKNIFFESMGSTLSLTAKDETDDKYPCVKTISCVNALIFSYLERYVLCHDPNVDIPKKNIMIIDVGHSKSHFFVFSVHRTLGEVIIEHKDYISPGKMSGHYIDDVFVEFMADRVRKSYPKFMINKTGDTNYQQNGFFRSLVMKLKHQLSINQIVSFTLRGIDEDITMQVTRKEFDDVIHSNELDSLIRTTFRYFHDTWDDVPLNHVEFVGGCSRIPNFKENFKSVFKDVSIGTMNVDESVANGACVYGWLLQNKNVAKTIRFIRSVRNPVSIRYPVIKQSKTSYPSDSSGTSSPKYLSGDVLVHDRLDKILTTFSRSDKKSSKKSDLTQLNCNKEDVSITRIRSANEIDIFVGNFAVRLVLDNVSPENEFLDVKLKYGVSDIVEIIGITDSKNAQVSYNILIQDSKDDTKFDKKFISLVREYTDIERQIVETEKMIERRQEFTNFMESYYFDKDDVNKLINLIARDQVEKNQSLELCVLDVDDTPASPLSTPLKEVYEFYQFCRCYCEESADPDKCIKKDRIETILSDDYSLKQMERAAQIIKNIKATYCC